MKMLIDYIKKVDLNENLIKMKKIKMQFFSLSYKGANHATKISSRFRF